MKLLFNISIYIPVHTASSTLIHKLIDHSWVHISVVYSHLQNYWLVTSIPAHIIQKTELHCILCSIGFYPVHFNGMKINSKMSGMSSHWISHTWKYILTLTLCSLVPQCCVWMSHEFEWGRVHRCVHNSYCTILVFVPCKRIITFQSHFSPQSCMVTLTFHTHSWQSIYMIWLRLWILGCLLPQSMDGMGFCCCFYWVLMGCLILFGIAAIAKCIRKCSVKNHVKVALSKLNNLIFTVQYTCMGQLT